MSEVEIVAVSSPSTSNSSIQSVEVAEERKRLHFITGNIDITR